jgi:signal transduction histidine kinase
LDFNRPPQVLVTAVKSGGQVVYRDLVGGERLEFTHRDDLLTFEFAALDYNAPHRSRYLYQLEGVDSDWVDSGDRRSAGYSDLKGGNYTFRVRAASGDNDLSESEVSIAVTITPPIWETPWFRVGILLLLLGLIAGGYRLRVGQIQRRNRELERRVAELSQQVQEAAVREERSRLARGLHDSVTQSLYSLTLLAEAGRRTLERGDTAQSQKNLNRVAEIAQQALQEMRLMVFQLRQPELEKLGLAGALEHRLEAVERRAGVNARLVVDLTQPLQPGIEEDLYWLAQEALNNALKHAGAESVIIHLVEHGECLMLEIRDSGWGFDPKTLQGSGGFGLTGMRERTEKLGGQLEVESKLGQGTCVRFTKQGPFTTG